MMDPGRVNEPHEAREYADVLSQVAAQGQPLIVCRDGVDLAAVIPLAYLEPVLEAIARERLEQRAARLNWAGHTLPRPPQAWFDDKDDPFEPEVGEAP